MPTTENAGAVKPRHDYADIVIALSTGLGLAVVLMYLCVQPLVIKLAAGRDFIVYWATGRQLAHGLNPYDAVMLGALEHQAGFPLELKTGLMRNPPWSLFLTAPLGYMGVRLGTIFWSLLEIACWALCCRLLWILFGRREPPVHWVALSFGPAMLCVIMGQTSLLAMLGFLLFLYLQEERPFLAGAALWLCMLKPHLLVFFWLPLLLWALRRRRYAVLGGAVAAFAAGLLLALLFDLHAYQQYAQMLRASGIENEKIPCFSMILRMWIHPQSAWIQYVPSALGGVGSVVYYWLRRRNWDWLVDGGLLAMLSIVFAPYSWIYDQAFMLPSLLYAAYQTRSRILVALLGIFSGAISVMLASHVTIFSMEFLWVGPIWLGWYIAARWLKQRPMTPPEPELDAL